MTKLVNPLRRSLAGLFAGLSAACLFAPAARAGSYDDFFNAIAANDTFKLKDVLGRGFDVNSVDPKGNRALYLAIRAGARDAFGLLIKQPGIEIDARNAADETALMMAALRDNMDATTQLVERGAALHKTGWSPVHYAATSPGSNVLKWLLDRGAPVEARSPTGFTPLLMAVRYGSDSSIDMLLVRGADKKARNERDQDAVALAREAKRDKWVEVFSR